MIDRADTSDFHLEPMNELSLFSGAGGGIWASRLLGWNTIGYVERNLYCRKVLVQRIRDGLFDPAPIWGDIRDFINDRWPETLRGHVNIITAGFPCQPFSVAGKRMGANDERNMWPQTAATIRKVRPKYAFLENVPGLLLDQYFGTILGDLASCGYDVRWDCISARALGAPHQRDRLWIVAHANDYGHWEPDQSECEPGSEGSANVRSHGPEKSLANAIDHRHSSDLPVQQAHAVDTRLGVSLSDGSTEAESDELQSTTSDCHPWEVEPNVGRVVDGVAHWGDRLTALGNGQVPAVVAAAWLHLSKG